MGRRKREHRKQMNAEIKHYKQVIRDGRKNRNRTEVREGKKGYRVSKKEMKGEKKDSHKLLKMILYRNKLMFSVLKGMLNGVWFIILYFAYIRDLQHTPFIWEGLKSLGLIALGITITRTLSWGIAFGITEHSNFEKNVQFVLRSAIITIFISILLFTEVFLTLYSTLDLKFSVGGYLLIQFLVFTLADFMADNFLFQH